jgi:cation:H+ antiporter
MRLEGAVLVGLYIVYVSAIWLVERRPPAFGEVHELEEAAQEAAKPGTQRRIGRELFLVLAGVTAMAAGATLLVEAVQRITQVESTQTVLGLTLVGFATALELVVLAWSAVRRGAPEAVVAGVVGSFAYNVTMTLGSGALARPLVILDAAKLHVPWLAMLAALCLVVLLAAPQARLGRAAGVVLLAAYLLFVLAALFA